MGNRSVELVALGPELRKLAERRGEGVIEALFLVHLVLEEAFSDLHGLPNEGLREHLASRMEHHLDARAATSPSEPRLTPMLWRFNTCRTPQQANVAASA